MFVNKKAGESGGTKTTVPPAAAPPPEKKHKKSKTKKSERKDKKKKEKRIKKKDKRSKKTKHANGGAGDVTEIKFSGGAEIDPSDLILSKELGGGCFGKVWKGEVHGKAVAIKVPHVQNLDADQLASLRNEIEIMSSNPHPNIVLFMGACTEPGQVQIVTELLDGDIEGLLHDSGTQLSLFERLNMAKDAALGMNWLHSVNPSIIHRDLKTANLLYKKTGNSYTIKVCDFGLSAIKPKDNTKMRDGKDGAKGTPLYMAPEVMASKEFNEKADVYSFGICLWEIYTCKDPFPHHNDYDEFVHAICKANERPPIPADCPPNLKKLMQDCWHPQAKKRPDFGEIIERLDQIIIEAAILDAEGREFWKTFYLKQHVIPWDDFVATFYKWMNLTLPTDAPPQHGEVPIVTDDVINLRVFKALVAESEHKKPPLEVHIQWFGNVLNWFGPLHRQPREPFIILDRMRIICSHAWFHGNLDTKDAQRKLTGQKPGTFLVRFSTNADYPGAFTITRVASNGSIGNVRIRQNIGVGFSVNDDNTYDNLEELMQAMQVPLNLLYACGSSPFLELFGSQEQEIIGYQLMG